MKNIVFAIIILFAATSCTTHNIYVVDKKPKKGHYMNSHNPHHPRTTNPGHTKTKVVTKKVVVAPGKAAPGKKKK